ncbi:MAG: hypothetical protein ACM3RX_02865 [Methanococcaceae archaeon]
MFRNITVHLLLSTFILVTFIFAGCEEEPKEPPKLLHKNAVEFYVTSTRDNNILVVTTKKDIYSNFKLISSTTTKDTLPNIGTEKVTSEDEEGNEIQTTEPLAYDIYFKAVRK